MSSALLLFFGVLLPVVTLAIEWLTGICAAAFFDPIPTVFHGLAVLAVPALNLVAWMAVQRRIPAPPSWVWWARGVATGVAGWYAVLFLHMGVPAVVGILFLGFGLLPLTPLLSWIATIRMSVLLRKEGLLDPGIRARVRQVAILTFLALALAGARAPLTRGWMIDLDELTSHDPQPVLRKLRWLGSEHEMLRAAHGRQDHLWHNFVGEPRVSVQAGRRAYYQVTGRSAEADSRSMRQAPFLVSFFGADDSWDPGLGGRTVGPRVSGLKLRESRIEGRTDSEQGWGYFEWTMEFQNNHPTSQREARMLLELPPGGVVSRATLWIEGEEREAAFGETWRVRQAYESVAVQQRKDPLLVTWKAPDEVLVQCFPIAPSGGLMKIRIGITAPMQPTAGDKVEISLPRVTERNFIGSTRIADQVSIDSIHTPTRLPRGLSFKGSRIEGRTRQTDGRSGNLTLGYARSTSSKPVWSRNLKSDSDHWVRQALSSVVGPVPDRVALVVDGSEGMSQHLKELSEILATIPDRVELGVWHAGTTSGATFRTGTMESDTWLRVLRQHSAAGGMNNVPSLQGALDWVAREPGGAVIWVHAGIPEILRSRENRLVVVGKQIQALQGRVYVAAVESRRNVVIEELDDVAAAAFVSLGRGQGWDRGLRQLVDSWRNGGRQQRWSFEERQSSVPTGDSADGSGHVVRLWAHERVRQLLLAGQREEAGRLAVGQQLVTPVTGAVVLETAQQYEANGLKPVDPSTVPAIPEPSTIILLGLGLAGFLVLRRSGRGLSVRPAPGGSCG